MLRPGFLLVLTLAGCAFVSSSRAAVEIDHPLVGTWRGISYEVWDERGRVTTPFGDPISGYAVFDQTGHAFIQMMRTPPIPPFASASEPTSAEIAAAFSAFAAYYGPYTIDPATSTFTIRVEGSNLPSYTHSEQVRRFVIEGDTLRLGVPGQYQATLARVR